MGDLEYPGSPGAADWASLYRARGDEVTAIRPIFTGDVFVETPVRGAPAPRKRAVMVVQHPCALRTNGVDLVARVLVAEVKPFGQLALEAWQGHLDKMPLPELIPEAEDKRRDQAAFFAQPYLVAAEDLLRENRIASLSPIGVNLLLQRWVAHNSRVVVETFRYQEVTSGPYEEADLLEEWCEERSPALGVDDASKEAVAWLREDLGEGRDSRQAQLADPQRVSSVRKEMRTFLRQR